MNDLNFRVDSNEHKTILSVLTICIQDDYYHPSHRLNRVLAILEYLYNIPTVKSVLTFYGHNLTKYGDISALHTVCLERYEIDIKQKQKENRNV